MLPSVIFVLDHKDSFSIYFFDIGSTAFRFSIQALESQLSWIPIQALLGLLPFIHTTLQDSIPDHSKLSLLPAVSLLRISLAKLIHTSNFIRLVAGQCYWEYGDTTRESSVKIHNIPNRGGIQSALSCARI